MILKRRLRVLLIMLILSISLFLAYNSYTKSIVREYIYFLNSTNLKMFSKLGIVGEVQLEKIIKQSPNNLVMLIKIGEDNKAYVTIENWMTKAHDRMQIHVIDNEKIIIIRE